MDKKDIMYVAVALIIILVIALIIKPVVTGQPLNTGIAPPSTPIPQPTQTIIRPNASQVSSVVVSSTPVPPPAPTPAPVPTWDKNVTSVEFVNPATYGISTNQSLSGSSSVQSVPANMSMTTIATISGKYSGTTSIMHIPFPYWEIWYTADPSAPFGGKDQKVGSSTVEGPKESGAKGSGSQTFIQGSFSVVNPVLSIQVMDGDDPNRIVRTITPPGGLDESLWTAKTDSEGNTISNDPRPWIEKFFEGQRNYFFIINAQSLDSYTIDIRVPSRYIG